jgi:plasmid stabilization system protein ParE
MKVRWTTTAKHSYFNILDYLEESWPIREVNSFIEEVDKFLDQISRHPKMFQESSKKRHVRKGYITKDNSLYYRYSSRKKEIELLVFWDNRQNPEKLIY